MMWLARRLTVPDSYQPMTDPNHTRLAPVVCAAATVIAGVLHPCCSRMSVYADADKSTFAGACSDCSRLRPEENSTRKQGMIYFVAMPVAKQFQGICVGAQFNQLMLTTCLAPYCSRRTHNTEVGYDTQLH
jgi:hypothetical protein